MTYITWFLMLVPATGQPTYVKPFPDAVSCQVRVIELRDEQPTKHFKCMAVKGPIDLSRPAQ